MGQYKSHNADRSDWCSFWSHSAVSIGRKSIERVFVQFPFVGVAGMMIESKGPPVGIGQTCEIHLSNGRRVLAEVVGVDQILDFQY